MPLPVMEARSAIEEMDARGWPFLTEEAKALLALYMAGAGKGERLGTARLGSFLFMTGKPKESGWGALMEADLELHRLGFVSSSWGDAEKGEATAIFTDEVMAGDVWAG